MNRRIATYAQERWSANDANDAKGAEAALESVTAGAIRSPLFARFASFGDERFPAAFRAGTLR